MGRLDDRVVAVTGAGRGIGKEIALLAARQGAKVVVNDLGGNTDGTGTTNIADEVVAEIRDAGGEAVANTESIAEVSGGQSLVNTAVETFGGMDVLVNNAGILRDKTIFNMEEADWDAVMAVHLKGHYCCSRPFAKYIREQIVPARASSTSPACLVYMAILAKLTMAQLKRVSPDFPGYWH